MGETPQVVKIACPGCGTQFRLKPKKGRLPEGSVPCPKCAESIPVVEENIRRDEPDKPASNAPQAAVFGKSSSGDTTKRSRTISGSPVTPHRTDAVTDDEEFDHVSASPGLSESNPKSTFLGMGSALAAIDGSRKVGDKTAVVDGDLLAKIRSESSVVEDDDDGDEASDHLRETAESSVHLRQTSENKAIVAPAGLETVERDDDSDSDQAPGQMVLGKIKIKKKLKRRSKDKATKPLGTAPRTANNDGASVPDSSNKPSLSALLKKARQRKDKIKLPSPSDASKETPAAAQRSAVDLDRALDDLANETARAIKKGAENDSSANDAPAFDSGDSTMIELLRRRVAENQQPGAASERRGSGYIRLPTAEIQDVLGQGTYRLRVEDIVYEPIDKQGLTQLVKRGVLLGAEQIAEADGDWMPIADHPVFKELRRKMAREAHDLLAKYGKPSRLRSADGESGSSKDTDLPGRVNELPGRVNELPRPATPPVEEVEDGIDFGDFAEADAVDEADDIPTLDAELEEEAAAAARDLFDDDDDVAAADAAPPPMPTPEATGAGAAAPEDEPSDVPTDESDTSIKLDYDALGVDEDDVEFEEPEVADETPTGATSGGSMRTWLPILVAAIVVGGIAALAFTPMGKPYLNSLLGTSSAKQPTKAAAPKPKPKTSAAPDHSKEIAAAVTAAASALDEALGVDPNDAALQKKVADQLVAAGDHEGATKILGVLWKSHHDDADFAARYANELVAAKRYADARAVAIAGIQLGKSKHDFHKLFNKALAEDPRLGDYHVVDITAGKQADSATAHKEGKRVVLSLASAGSPTFAFKPSQSGWEDGWRSDIAAWRLCEIMACNFEVPRSRPARMDKSTLTKLTAHAKGNTKQLVSSLRWVSKDGKKYVYGALQDAVATPARFPIEHTDMWRHWLATGASAKMYDTPAKKALASVAKLPGGLYKPLAAQLGDTKLRVIARELSSVLVFDFLTNNWDRFRRGEENWGTNLHLADGHLVSMDNGTTFEPRASTRVRGRFHWTSRFSKDTITSLRLLDPKVVSEMLFPHASAAEKARLGVFWSQRDKVLKRVDSLAGAHGKKEVLAFQ